MAAVESNIELSPSAKQAGLTIEEFLEQEAKKELLRFFTCGSVDDGKSTLIGRLLYDARGIYEDQLASIQTSKVNRSTGPIDFSLLTDGLRAEREQGITIDVAYRYFSTPKRKFIIADTPGHEQYTRNMATGASTASLAIVLVDARHGVLPQTRRHATIASLLGIPRVVVAVNKMDLLGFREEVYRQIVRDFHAFADTLGFEQILAIPVSALEGDNVTARSARTPWYDGPSLMEVLETAPASSRDRDQPARFPVQYVIRPNQDFRGYAGQIASGVFRRGDEVVILPSGQRSRIASIVTFHGELEEATAPASVTLTLKDERDISRGDLLAHPGQEPQVARQFEADVVWMVEDALTTGRNFLLKHTTQLVNARVTSIESRLDIATMERSSAHHLSLNDIGVVRIEASRPILFDPYRLNRATGSFILIDPISNLTAGAGMIRHAIQRKTQDDVPVTPAERAARNHHAPALLRLSDRELARRLERRLFDHGCQVVFSEDLSAARGLFDAGLIVISPAIDDPSALDLNALPLPASAASAIDAIVDYLEQKGVLESGSLNLGEGI
ncbi:MAG: sulfate adenylyltransferase subunit CysN [Bryobacteraceae bacterium]|nr:sulfate adenylyltransferase subunit CysN [Bryobacteraceae bacterium]MDW8377288.1 sulfate adenylyltransferase subunit CysN [Bryobacterales bacterium]